MQSNHTTTTPQKKCVLKFLFENTFKLIKKKFQEQYMNSYKDYIKSKPVQRTELNST